MATLLFLLGLCIGSFLNVVICRVPVDRSVITPSSHCPVCQKPIAPYDLIPVVSWLILRGHCRQCRTAISWRYPATELLTGLLFLWVFYAYGEIGFYMYWPEAVLTLVLACVLVAISFIDIDHGIIPFSILAFGAVPALSFAVFSIHIPVWDALVGAVAGGGSILAVDALSRLLYKRQGMGGGDVALMLMAGLFLGLQCTLLSLLIGVVLGGVFAVYLLLSGRANKEGTFAFGPFLAVGIWVSTLYGQGIINWYLSWLLYE